MAKTRLQKVRQLGTAAAATAGVTIPSGGVVPIKPISHDLLMVHRVRVEIPALQFLLTAAGGGAADAQSQKLLTLPAGRFLQLAVLPQFTVTTPDGVSIATAVWSLGTAAATADNASLTSTEADILSSQTLGDGTLAAGASETESAAVLGTGTAVALVGASDAETDVYFSIGGTTTHASDTAPVITIDGTIDLVLVDLGADS